MIYHGVCSFFKACAAESAVQILQRKDCHNQCAHWFRNDTREVGAVR